MKKWDDIYGETPEIFHNSLINALDKRGAIKRKPSRLPALLSSAAALAICAVLGIIIAHKAPPPDVTNPLSTQSTHNLAQNITTDIADCELNVTGVFADYACMKILYELEIGGVPASATGWFNGITPVGGEKLEGISCASGGDVFRTEDGRLIQGTTLNFDEAVIENGVVEIRFSDIRLITEDEVLCDGEKGNAWGDFIDGEITFEVPIDFNPMTKEQAKRADINENVSVIAARNYENYDEEQTETSVYIYSVELTQMALRIVSSTGFDIEKSVQVKYKNGDVADLTRGKDGISGMGATWGDNYTWTILHADFRTPIDVEQVYSVIIGDKEIVF